MKSCRAGTSSIVSSVVLFLAALVHGCDHRRRSKQRQEAGRIVHTRRNHWAVFFSLAGTLALFIRLSLLLSDITRGGGAREGCILTDIIAELVGFLILSIWAVCLPPWSSKPLLGLIVGVGTAIDRLCEAWLGKIEHALTKWELAEESIDVAAFVIMLGLIMICIKGKCQSEKKRRRRKRRRDMLKGDGAALRDPLLDGPEDEHDWEEGEMDDTEEPPSPLDRAGFFARLAFTWVNPLLSLGAKRQLVYEDVPELPENDDTRLWARRFLEAIAAERMTTHPSLLRLGHVTFGSEYYYLGALQLINDLLGFSGPILLKLVVTYIQKYTSGRATLEEGYFLLVIILTCYVASALLSTQYSLRMSRVQLHIRTALVSAVYGQVLQCRSAELVTMNLGSGEVTNMMTVDVQRIQDAASSFNQFWSLPIQVAITLHLLHREVSYAFVAGLTVIALMIPVNMVIAKAITRVTQKQMSYKDKRVMTCDELLHGIRALKILAWEDHLKAILAVIRGQEVHYLSQRKYLDALCVYFWAATPVLTSLSTFALVVLLDHQITPAAVFTTISLLNMLIFPMNAFPWVVNGLMEARVSKRRLQRFLLEMRRPAEYVVDLSMKMEMAVPAGTCVDIQGSFAWDGGNFVGEKAVSRGWSAEGRGDRWSIKDLPMREVEVEALQGLDLITDHEEEEEEEREAGVDAAVWDGGDSSSNSSSGGTSTVMGGTGNQKASFELRGIQMNVAAGEIVGVYGKIGNGKSTLLAAILGELYASEGSRVCLNARSKAYCSQTAWLQRGTILEAIVFGQPWNAERFDQVIEACGLAEDLGSMRYVARTEIGDRGGTLSGGQRLRISMARALYSRADLYLLDDPFSGLDGRTASHVAREAIYGMMRKEGATVILVTHSLPLLEGCDWAVAMQGGRLVEGIRIINKRRASQPVVPTEFSSTTTSSDERAKKAVDRAAAAAASSSSAAKVEEIVLASSTTTAAGEGALASEETREQGRVKFSVYMYYICSIGKICSTLIVFTLMGMQLSANAFSYWLSLWSANPSNFTPQRFLEISLIIAGINTTFTLARSFLFAYGGLRAARLLHDKLLSAVLATGLSFFEMNPVGRILNRFAQDTYTIDDSLPFMSNILLAQGAALTGTTIVLLVASPWSGLVLIVIAAFYYRLQGFYRASSRELKRLDSVSRSPIYVHFSESLDGAVTIRAFSTTDRFLAHAITLVDANQRVSFCGSVASQWLALRLQAFGVLVVASVAGWAIISCAIKQPASAGLVGLSLSYALPIVGNLSSLMGSYTETEKEMVSVERISEYTSQPPEPDIMMTVSSHSSRREGALALPPSSPLVERQGGGGWPWVGRILIEDLTLRYGPGWPLALNRISCSIQGGEKVGIVGRTGSGKSSLLACLFRLVNWEGRIKIDGMSIDCIPLKQLRSSLAIIPQEPTLFAGTIRSNLDPAKQYSDAEIHTAFQACRLDAILGEQYGSIGQCLAAEVAEKGVNFSLGQRQLFCLCRVLLKKSKIVCVDEATANLDVATDAITRRTIAESFKDATVIMIAHRMTTVLDLCSRVLVLSEGRLMEEGDPQRLIKDRGSYLARLQAEEQH